MRETIEIIKTNSDNTDYIHLKNDLDQYLWDKYPVLKTDYWGNNILEFNPNVLVIYIDKKAVACGCFKKYDEKRVEIKRMFVAPAARDLGLAKQILQELEDWASSLGYTTAILETLHKQKEAIGLYQKCGYMIVANYEPYIGLANSVCMQKEI
jgi:GNAT superfamily N-acetyltransferase